MIRAAFLLLAAFLFISAPSSRAPAEEDLPAPRWIGLYDLGGKAGLQWIHDARYSSVEVFRREKGSDAAFDLVGRSPAGRYIDADVTPGTSYTYRLFALDDKGGRGKGSAERSLRIAPTVKKPVSPPAWEGYLLTETGVGLKWARRPDDEVLAYNVYRRGEGEELFELIGSTKDTSFHDRNVEEKRTYVYVLRALDPSFNESGPSDELLILLPERAPVVAEPADLPRRDIRTRLVKIVTRGDGPLVAPADVALDPSGQVFLSDSGSARIQVYDRDGGFLRAIGGGGLLVRPLGLAAGKAGEIYCVDSGRNTVLALSSTGAVSRRLSLGEHFRSGTFGLIDAALAPDGTLFVVDNHHGRLLSVSASDKVEIFGARGFAPGELSAPTFCAFDGAGNFYLSDSMNGRGQVFDGRGNFVRTFGQYRQGPGGFGRPKGIAVERGGRVFVADSWQNIVQVFDGEGRYLAHLTDELGKPLDLGSPNGIALGAGGRIYIAERLARRLQIRELLDE